MKVKNRSLKSISNWGLGRCRGKIKGYTKRIEEIATTIKVTNSLGQLTDDLLVELVRIGTELLVQKLKAEYRELELMNPKGDWNKEDKWFETARAYDMMLLTWKNNNYTLYRRYRSVIKEKTMKIEMKDVPPEVLEAYDIMQLDMVGEFLYNKAVDAVNKYPQYFSKDEVDWAREYKERNNE